MSWSLVLATVNAGLISGIGIFVVTRSRRNASNWLFFLATLFLSSWIVILYLSDIHYSHTLALFWNKMVLVVAIVWSMCLYNFVLEFPRYDSKYQIARYFSLIGILLAALSIFSNSIVRDIEFYDGGVNIITGIAYPIYMIWIGILLFTLFVLAIVKHRNAKGIERSQLQYFLLGIVIFTSIAFLFNVILPAITGLTSFAELGTTAVIIFTALTAYAIVAHQLFDIRVIIKKTLEYSGLLIFTLGTYSMIIFFFSALLGGSDAFNAKNFWANLFAATLIAFGFDPIKRYLTRVTDKYLFKGEYDPQAVLAELSQQLSASLDIRQATQSLVMLIKKEMRLKQTAVITFTTEESQVVVKDAIQDGYPDASFLQLRPENLLLQYFARTPEVIVTEAYRQQCETGNPSDTDVQACKLLLVDMDKLQVAIAIPILVDKKAIGMFLVGEKLSGDVFTKDDVEFLTIVANQTANTIEKTRFWQEDQMKSEFVSIASHELLTPTAAMKGYLSMILDENMGQVDDRARGYLTKVATSADRLALLVEELLNVSRIESGRLTINKREFSLVESVTKAVDELQVNAKSKSLDLAFVASATPLANVYADPDHMYRVLVNLIGNSIKYTQTGWVRCFVTQMSPTHLLFTVSDSGLGIPKDAIPHLFEKFNRADRKAIAGIQGTGLGLYISKKIVDMMGGQMWVQSEEGKGTNFYFTLPISTSVTPAPSAQTAQSTVTTTVIK